MAEKSETCGLYNVVAPSQIKDLDAVSWFTRKVRTKNYVLSKYGGGPAKEYGDVKAAGKVSEVERKKDELIGHILHELDQKPNVTSASNYFSKFTVSDSQELIVSSMTNWLLPSKDMKAIFKGQPPSGIIRTLSQSTQSLDNIYILWPVEENLQPPDIASIHQIVRELMLGIYIMNQIPFLSLEAKYDQSTACHFPTAYQDTHLGQLMLAVDYIMKCLWHGAYFPFERLLNFNDSWKSRFRMTADGEVRNKLPILYEYRTSGLYDVTREEAFSGIYDELPKKLLKPLKPPANFLQEMEDVIITLTFYQRKVVQSNGVFVLDADYFPVGTRISAAEDMGGFEHTNEYCHALAHVIKSSLCKKQDIHHKLEVLKLVSLLVPLFTVLKQKKRIPRLTLLQPPFQRESTVTQRSLPPITVGPEFKNSSFYQEDKFFHMHGGIQFDVETPTPEELESEMYVSFKQIWAEIEDKAKTNTKANDTKLPMVTLEDKKYYVLHLPLEFFNAEEPRKPTWINPIAAEMAWIKFMRLPLINSQIFELFKTYYGAKQAAKYQDLEWALHESAARGLVSIVHALIRLMPATRLEKQSEEGLSVTHVAAMHNNVHVLGQLSYMGLNMNTRKGMYKLPTGLTPLHLAARVGAMQSLSFLLASGANVNARDQNGFAPIHHAAWNNQLLVVRLLVKQYQQLELETTDEEKMKQTPLLLAAQRGALETMICLLDMGAKRNQTDAIGRNCIVLAALEYRHHILDFFIHKQFPDMVAWNTLVEMLESEEVLWRYGSTKTVETLSGNPTHLQSILKAGIPQLLIKVLEEVDENMQRSALISLSNICHDDDVRLAISSAEPIPVFVNSLLGLDEKNCTMASLLVYSITNIGDNKDKLGEAGAIEALVALLAMPKEELLLEAVNAIYELCLEHKGNQVLTANCGGIHALVRLMDRTDISDDLLLKVCQTSVVLVSTSAHHQLLMVQANGIAALSKLLHSTNVAIQICTANILGVLATSHRKAINPDVMKPMIAMLKVWDMDVRIQGASALSAIAGNTMAQQKFTATSIGVKLLINMLLTKNPELVHYGCRFICAYAKEDISNQNVFVKEGGVEALVRYTVNCDDHEQEHTIYEIIKTLGIICVGVAHTNNALVQKQITKQDTMRCLTKSIASEKISEELKVEVVYTLACVILNNEDNLKRLGQQGGFCYDAVSKLMKSKKEHVRIKAGMALSTYAFNKERFENERYKAGKIGLKFFVHFLRGTNELNKCLAAFQMAVLAPLVDEADPITTTAKGLAYLVYKLHDQNEDIFTSTASLISSLARSRVGLPDGLISLGVIGLLTPRLRSENTQVRTTCAVALGYLSYNAKASRQLLMFCRQDPEIFDLLMSTLQSRTKISHSFVEAFQLAKRIGLPMFSVDTNKLREKLPKKKLASKKTT